MCNPYCRNSAPFIRRRAQIDTRAHCACIYHCIALPLCIVRLLPANINHCIAAFIYHCHYWNYYNTHTQPATPHTHGKATGPTSRNISSTDGRAVSPAPGSRRALCAADIALPPFAGVIIRSVIHPAAPRRVARRLPDQRQRQAALQASLPASIGSICICLVLLSLAFAFQLLPIASIQHCQRLLPFQHSTAPPPASIALPSSGKRVHCCRQASTGSGIGRPRLRDLLVEAREVTRPALRITVTALHL